MNIENLTIDELVELREKVGSTLYEKVQARQAELEAERNRLSSIQPALAVKPKYRHPDKPELVWGGRGSKPHWLEEYLEAGGTLDECKAGA